MYTFDFVFDLNRLCFSTQVALQSKCQCTFVGLKNMFLYIMYWSVIKRDLYIHMQKKDIIINKILYLEVGSYSRPGDVCVHSLNRAVRLIKARPSFFLVMNFTNGKCWLDVLLCFCFFPPS